MSWRWRADAGDHVGVLERGEQQRQVGRVVLQVGVQRDDDVAAGARQARGQRRALPGVALERQRAHARVARLLGQHELARAVGAAVVHDHHLPRAAGRIERRAQLGEERRQALDFVVGRHDGGERGAGVHEAAEHARGGAECASGAFPLVFRPARGQHARGPHCLQEAPLVLRDASPPPSRPPLEVAGLALVALAVLALHATLPHAVRLVPRRALLPLVRAPAGLGLRGPAAALDRGAGGGAIVRGRVARGDSARERDRHREAGRLDRAASPASSARGARARCSRRSRWASRRWRWRSGHYYSMNAFDIVVLGDRAPSSRCARFAARARRWWLALGLTLGLGLLNKWSVAWLGAGLAVALVASPSRRALRTPWPWLAALIAAAIVSPNLAWQARHGWPTLEFMRNASANKMRAFDLGGLPAGAGPRAGPWRGAALARGPRRRGSGAVNGARSRSSGW